ncbi:hypothetical protein MH1LPH_25510 [Lactiplantibacillus brownii]
MAVGYFLRVSSNLCLATQIVVDFRLTGWQFLGLERDGHVSEPQSGLESRPLSKPPATHC